MKFKKILTLILTAALATSILAGCKKEEKKEAEKPAWQNEKITLKYASWEDKEIVDAMLKAFTEKYPNITVEKDESINGNWTDALANAASAGKLPDAFIVENVPTAVQNEWLLDLREYWNKDKDAKSVYPNVAQTSVYNNKRFAVPTSQSIMGVFVNKTLLQKSNIPIPSYNWTFEQMIDIAKKVSNPSKNTYGLCGAWGNLSFDEHLPMINSDKVGYNTFDGAKMNFNAKDWIDGYNLKLELRRTGVEEKMTAAQKKEVFGDENAWPTMKGNVALSIDGSWNLGWLPKALQEANAGEMDFYPYPAGKAGQRMPVILDYAGVSATTKHPEAAYELLKWMTYGKDGWEKRLEVYKQLNKDVAAFPVADYKEVWDKIPAMLKTEGAKEAVKLLSKAVPDINKWVPGWREYNAWLDQEKIKDSFAEGKINPADKAKELEDKANEFIKKGFENLKK